MQPRLRPRTHHPFNRPAPGGLTTTIQEPPPKFPPTKVPPALTELPSPRRLTSIATGMQWNIVLIMAFLLIISHFARPFERFQIGGRIPAIICTLGIIVALTSGALQRLTSPIGLVVGAYVSWMLLCTPFSNWKGGSADYVLWFIAFWVILMLILGHAIRTARHISRLAGTIACSCMFFLVLGSQQVYGRLGVNGTFGNSDDVALMAGFAIPFAVLAGRQIKQPAIRFLVIAGSTLYFLQIIGLTATRAAVIALTGMLGVYFLRSKAGHKVGILIAAVVALTGLLLTLPKATLERFATIADSFDSEAPIQQADQSEAMASTAERRDLLQDAMTMVRDNPIFGVGPGEYSDYRASQLRDALGRRKRFLASHNTYAQIAAESGIPGFILYLVFLFTIYRTILRIRKVALQTTHPDSALLQQIAVCLEAALVYFALCALFMTCDKHPHQFVIAGMAIGGERLLHHWGSQIQQSSQAASQLDRSFRPTVVRT